MSKPEPLLRQMIPPSWTCQPERLLNWTLLAWQERAPRVNSCKSATNSKIGPPTKLTTQQNLLSRGFHKDGVVEMSIQKKRFESVKAQFFPHRDRKKRWCISTRSKRNVAGYCDTERRVIEILIDPSDLDEWDKLLIHEICHTVASEGHGICGQESRHNRSSEASGLVA